jgi:hypothetical protein
LAAMSYGQKNRCATQKFHLAVFQPNATLLHSDRRVRVAQL